MDYSAAFIYAEETILSNGWWMFISGEEMQIQTQQTYSPSNMTGDSGAQFGIWAWIHHIPLSFCVKALIYSFVWKSKRKRNKNINCIKKI